MSERPDRLPPLALSALDEAQRRSVEVFTAERGSPPFGPFQPLLRSPELMLRVARLGAYCRYESAIGVRLTELVVLLVARRYDQGVEWALHLPHARAAGLDEATIAAISEGRRPQGMAEDEAAVYDALQELWATGGLSDVTYSVLVERFGERGVIDLVATAGYYALLAQVLNVARTPAPGGFGLPILPL